MFYGRKKNKRGCDMMRMLSVLNELKKRFDFYGVIIAPAKDDREFYDYEKTWADRLIKKSIHYGVFKGDRGVLNVKPLQLKPYEEHSDSTNNYIIKQKGKRVTARELKEQNCVAVIEVYQFRTDWLSAEKHCRLYIYILDAVEW